MSAQRLFPRLARGLSLALVALAVTGASAAAQMGRTAINVDENGVILHGYDAVAFHTDMRAVMGSAAFTATHDGAIYRFSSAANRETFRANPTKFTPAYGGYCAMGVAVGKKLEGDPMAFTVNNGRLYLNVNQDVKKTWTMDIAGNNMKADANWAKVAMRSMFDKM